MYSFLNQLIFVFVLVLAQPNTVYDRIGKLIKENQVKELSGYFESTIEITLLNKEGIYNKTQAEMVLKDFFKQNPPMNFQVTHRGNSNDDIYYAIGMLTTKNNSQFRTYFFLKEKSGQFFLQELRFEAN